MKRLNTIMGLGLMAIGLSLTGCDKGGDQSTPAPGGGSTPAATTESTEVIKLVGAGASFPAPLYSQWFKDYHAAHPNVIIEYQSIGSGGGITQFTAGTTNFGASDAAMSDEEIAKVDGGVTLLPMTAGSIVLAYNLDGVADLKLSRDTYVGIFMGTVTKWNDPKIASTNSGVTLPDMPINVVHRSDGSGTTFVFTTHLNAVSKDWAAGPAVGKTVKWPVGVGGKGNEGVSALLKQTPGSIGYIEYGYLQTAGLPAAELENKAGKYVKASLETASASLGAVQMPENLRAWLPDPEGDNSYPIVTYTWILAHPKYTDAKIGNALKDVIKYGLHDGQKISAELGYVPLPANVVEKVEAAVDAIKVE
ncbi:MAG: phosphate ABC transporter substrate-binding protein PstS [Planctomycetes bacterium]|nr:phosphate ABC transporter substrate-binding protein PstS [Planctomycetota bacterium]